MDTFEIRTRIAPRPNTLRRRWQRTWLSATRVSSVVAVACFFSTFAAYGNSLTGTIDALLVDPGQNGGFVRLTGTPSFDGTGCTNGWASGNLDDDRFMIYIWPALMSAKSQGKSVTISVSGCYVGFPKIAWVQINAT